MVKLSKKRGRKKPYPPMRETDLQQQFIKWVRQHPDERLDWLHAVPNAAKRSVAAAARAKAEGLLAGVADIFLPYAIAPYHGLYLEFKLPASYQSPRQKKFQQYCDDHGYLYVVVKSLETAKTTVADYLDNEYVTMQL